LALIPHTLLLVKVRRRPALWLVIFPMICVTAYIVQISSISRKMWEYLIGLQVPMFYAGRFRGIGHSFGFVDVAH
jgi:hypothetical protein